MFTVIVSLFTGFTWLGALIIRPKHTRIEHFTVVAADAQSNMFHVHSWLSLFDARHGSIDVSLNEDDDESSGGGTFHHTLASPGVTVSALEGHFADEQRYNMSALDAGKVTLPMRATAKQFEIDYLQKVGQNVNPNNPLSTKWVMPQGELREVADVNSESFWLKGNLSHNLPGPLTDVLFIYCRGANLEPMAWTQREWLPKIPVTFNGQIPKNEKGLRAAEMLVTQTTQQGKLIDRYTGFLPRVMGSTAGQSDDETANVGKVKISPLRVVRESQVLSLFGSMPPPQFDKVAWPYPKQYQRALCRQMDISHLLKLRRLIVIGHIKDSPLPAPLTVDGDTPASKGWTVVQWVYTLPEPLEGEE